MSESINVSQKAAIGSDTTQIGTQTNIYGMSPEAASKIAIDLFIENFPKLQETAQQVAKERADELVREILGKLGKEGVRDYTAFSEPDMQYILFEAQKGYARFGTEELCAMLSALIADRTKYNDEAHVKAILDRAIEIAPMMQPMHIDLLTITFMSKHIKFKNIQTVDDIVKLFQDACAHFQLPKGPQEIKSAILFLDMLGCFSIGIGDPYDSISKQYGLSKNELVSAMPSEITGVPADYILTPIGVVSAVLNMNNKFQHNVDFRRFI